MNSAGSHIIFFGFPHSLWLVVLSVAVAICSGYVGLGLAAEATNAFGLRRRGLIAGAAWSLGLGIWTMHFIGMLAAVMPEGTLYSVLLTLLSFLLCVLVVGVAAFIVSNYRSQGFAVMVAAVIMGMGIVLMHYLGMHAIIGNYVLHHDLGYSVVAAMVAVAASYGALHMFELEANKSALAISAIIFGLAVSGMHYTAMMGMTVMPMTAGSSPLGPAVTSDALMIVVAVLAFVVSAVFLLYLIPEKIVDELELSQTATPAPLEPNVEPERKNVSATTVPVESEGTTRLFPVGDVHSIHATTHYCLVFDGQREYFSPWSITEMENKLDKENFMRVHRSHIVNVPKVRTLRKVGDGATLEIGNSLARTIPVSRNNYAALKLRLGLQAKLRSHAPRLKLF